MGEGPGEVLGEGPGEMFEEVLGEVLGELRRLVFGLRPGVVGVVAGRGLSLWPGLGLEGWGLAALGLATGIKVGEGMADWPGVEGLDDKGTGAGAALGLFPSAFTGEELMDPGRLVGTGLRLLGSGAGLGITVGEGLVLGAAGGGLGVAMLKGLRPGTEATGVGVAVGEGLEAVPGAPRLGMAVVEGLAVGAPVLIDPPGVLLAPVGPLTLDGDLGFQALLAGRGEEGCMAAPVPLGCTGLGVASALRAVGASDLSGDPERGEVALGVPDGGADRKMVTVAGELAVTEPLDEARASNLERRQGAASAARWVKWFEAR